MEIEAILDFSWEDVADPIATGLLPQLLDNMSRDLPQGQFICECIDNNVLHVRDYVLTVRWAVGFFEVEFRCVERQFEFREFLKFTLVAGNLSLKGFELSLVVSLLLLQLPLQIFDAFEPPVAFIDALVLPVPGTEVAELLAAATTVARV